MIAKSIYSDRTLIVAIAPISFVNLTKKAGEIIKLIEKDGWHLVRQKGSYKQYKHAVKKGLVSIAAHKLSDEIAPGTLSSIYKQAQIDAK